MATIRRFKERVQKEFSKGGIPSFVYTFSSAKDESNVPILRMGYKVIQ